MAHDARGSRADPAAQSVPAGFANARQALIVRRLPLFAGCWAGTTTLWSSVLVLEGLLRPELALVTIVLQCTALLVAYQLCRRRPGARRTTRIIGATCVLLGLSSTVMFAAARGSGDVLAFVLLTLYLSAALFFAWGWHAQMALWIATVVPWFAMAPFFLTFAIRRIELAAAIVIGSVLSWAIAEGAARTFRAAWIHRAAEERTRRELETARDLAESATRAKDEFLATVSHELRSPLSAVVAWAQLLRGGRLEPARAAHALDVIEQNAKLQARLIADLLDVARIASGKLHVEPVSVDVRVSVREVVDTVSGDAEMKRIAIAVTLRDEPLYAFADPSRVHQILVNLLANALKFTAEGGRVEIGAARAGDTIEITVRDTGIGMTPDVMARIFDRFSQADSSAVRRQGGLGLGLSVVRHLVVAQGGTIDAESAGPGRGSSFRVRLPLDVDAPAPAALRSVTELRKH